jgi:hypothetical protein
MLDDVFLEKIDHLAMEARWVGSGCTGAFILGAKLTQKQAGSPSRSV